MTLIKKESYSWMAVLKAGEFDQAYVEDKLANYRYVGQLESGEKTGYVHWQIFIDNTGGRSIRFSTLKNSFPSGHFEPYDKLKGSKNACVAYVTKNETSLGVRIGTMSEEDIITAQKAAKAEKKFRDFQNTVSDWCTQISLGVPAEKIIATDTRSFRYQNQLRGLEQAHYAERMRPFETHDRDVHVHYIWGDGYKGKSFFVQHVAHNPQDVYRVTKSKNPFDFYEGQPVLLFEEFRSDLPKNEDNLHLPVSQMLNLLDSYPVPLDIRYRDKWAAYNTVYITSNVSFDEQFPDLDPATRRAWQRRIDTVSEMINYKPKVKETPRHDLTETGLTYLPGADKARELTPNELKQIRQGILFDELEVSTAKLCDEKRSIQRNAVALAPGGQQIPTTTKEIRK